MLRDALQEVLRRYAEERGANCKRGLGSCLIIEEMPEEADSSHCFQLLNH
jgi:hypothetical protein